MNLGKRITKCREKNRISQTGLARGFISVSHLSNIEKGRYDLREDMAIILSERLGVPKEYLLNYDVDDPKIESLLLSLMEDLASNLHKAAEIISWIKHQFPYINSISQETLFALLESCYYLKIRKFSEAERVYQEDFLPMISGIDPEKLPEVIKRYYHYYNGVSAFFTGNYFLSNDHYFKQLQLVDEKGKGDILYNISHNFWKLQDLITAIYYAKEAINKYTHQNDWASVADSYNLMGVLYWENKHLDEAIQYLNKALELTEKNNNQVLSRIYHNLGLIYIQYKDDHTALTYLKDSLDMKLKIQDSETIMTYRALINTLLRLNCHDEAKHYLQQALAFPTVFPSDMYHLQFVEAKLLLHEGDGNRYENLMSDAINHFKEIEDWYFLTPLAQHLGEYYQKNKKYKLAAETFALGMKAYNNMRNKGRY